MDTQETGPLETTDTVETGTSDTSQASGSDDADSKRIADKKAYMAALDTEIRELESRRNGARPTDPEDADEVLTWTTVNGDDLKMVAKEYQEELAFYKSHKIPVTNAIRDRALREAKNRKGLVASDQSSQKAVTTEVTGEHRHSSKPVQIPPSVLKHAPHLTPEKYAEYQEEFRARGLKV